MPAAPRIARIALDRPLDRLFDYQIPDALSLAPGQRVRVPFGRGTTIGVVVTLTDQSEVPANRLRPVLEAPEAEPLLAPRLMQLLQFGARYYHHPLGEALLGALPPALRHGDPLPALTPETLWRQTPEGARALAAGEVRGRRQQAVLRALERGAPALDRATLAAATGLQLAPRELRALAERGWLEAITPDPEDPPTPNASNHALTPDQRAAVDALTPETTAPLLLEGVTGSGKTEVYLQMAERVLARGKQVLFLIPEIALTPQLSARIQQRFPGQVALLHSGLAEGERLRAWEAARRGQRRIVVGTRSALFTPVPDLGLIIVDEEHDSAFKQQDGFRYNARDLAIKRGQLEQAPVVLGSATPTLESLHAATTGRYGHARLTMRPDGTQPPTVETVDTRVHTPDEGLTAPLLDTMQQTLAAGHQCFLLLNRRGFARVLACDACGWVAECPDCDARLTIHAHNPRAVCHLCGHQETRPERCPECGEPLAQRGLGTQRLEQALARHFPNIPLIRLDRDSIRHKGALEAALDRIRQLDAAIVVGTQMLAKGHDFPQVGLVGVIDVDQGLFSVDLRATENTLQLIVQAAGRAGRGSGGGRVLLQTGHPDHPLIRGLDAADYPAMVAPLLEERAAAEMPPYGHLALVRVEAGDAETTRRHAERVATHLRNTAAEGLRVLGPAPAPRHRVNRRFREQILLQSTRRNPLHESLARARQAWQADDLPRGTRIAIDIDPVSLA
ncbi:MULTISPECIES: primosomal protein N' [unclassified Thioalkalivibrio]|uniref:primosomal protein N' n=1 Tax=unclassified Thioalkalivibrio TaxID=2621013 RepID=UPI000376E977|nr:MULTISPECIES: primosomal protein N' [unclassified Thioalkalivibrio]